MPSAPLRIVIIEDQLLLRQSLATSLSSRLKLTVCGEFDSVARVRAANGALAQADVALVDIRLGAENSFGLVHDLRSQYPSLHLIWMTCADEDYMLEQAFAANLPGFVHKEDPLAVLVTAIEVVSGGGRFYSESILQLLRTARAKPEYFSRILSPREQEILRYLGAGFTNAEAAALLGLSAGTLQAHRRNIMARLNLHSAAELQAYALRGGFTDVRALKSPPASHESQ